MPAAGGDHTSGCLFLDPVDALFRPDGGGVHVPVHRDGLDLAGGGQQALVA